MAPAKSPRRIQVLVVDDHTIVRDGICALLARSPDIQVVGDAQNGKQAIVQADALHPDVVLMDISMPEMDGLEATRRITQSHPNTRVLVLTQHDSIEYVLPVLQAGAVGYAVKQARAEELLKAIRAFHAQDAYLPARVLHTLVDRLAQAAPSEQPSRSLLTERERQVLLLYFPRAQTALFRTVILSRFCEESACGEWRFFTPFRMTKAQLVTVPSIACIWRSTTLPCAVRQKPHQIAHGFL